MLRSDHVALTYPVHTSSGRPNYQTIPLESKRKIILEYDPQKNVGSSHLCLPNHRQLSSSLLAFWNAVHLFFSEIIARLANLHSSRGRFQPSLRPLLLLCCSHGSIYMSRLLLTSTIFSLPIVLIILLRPHFFKHLTIFSHHSADHSQPPPLVSLNLSVAFDTIDHSTLLSRLTTCFGANGALLLGLLLT